MVFSSPIFLFIFSPVFFALYLLSPARFKDALILIASILFYTWGANYFILFVFVTCVIDYRLGTLIYEMKGDEKRIKLYKFYIFIDVFINLGILIFFKYTNFFVANVNAVRELMSLEHVVFPRILLPIGISFIVFQKMTYCLDISAGKAKPAPDFFTYFEYMLIFPALIVGPIIKYNVLAPQFKNKDISVDNMVLGFRRFAVGLAKKVLIADTVARYANMVFGGSAALVPIHYTWIGIVCYTLQIYFDFSGYSDMAIGMLKIMGFTIPENFNYPYISKSITEFWKRWHISLTSWMREYIYIPLGGNRKGVARMYINLWTVFFLSGLWHGAGWNYVLYGIVQGSILCLERAFLLKATEKVPNIIKLMVTVILIMLGLVIFRTENLRHCYEYFRQMFNFSSIGIHTQPERILVIDNFGKFIILLGSFICLFPFFEKPFNWLAGIRDKFPRIILILCFVLFCVSAAKVGTASFSPFIYFQF